MKSVVGSICPQLCPSIELLVSFIKYFSSRISIWLLFYNIQVSANILNLIFLMYLNILSIDIIESMSAIPIMWTPHHHHGSISIIWYFFCYSFAFSCYFWLNTILDRDITLLSSVLIGQMNLSHLIETIKSMLPKVLQWIRCVCNCQPKNTDLLTDPAKWRSYRKLSRRLPSEAQMREEHTLIPVVGIISALYWLIVNLIKSLHVSKQGWTDPCGLRRVDKLVVNASKVMLQWELYELKCEEPVPRKYLAFLQHCCVLEASSVLHA